MDKKQASDIVIQWYTKAKEPSLGYLLDRYAVIDSGGIGFYRPFIVAALMMRAEQKTLIKADVAQWQINEEAFRTLLQMQLADDNLSGIEIPPGLSVGSLESSSQGSDYGIGITLI